MTAILTACLALTCVAPCLVQAADAEEGGCGEVVVVYSEAQGIGPEKGVMRRDPSDIIKVGDLYYVWYSKGPKSSGYDATVWYATSPDGRKWTEKGMAVGKGKPGSGSFDEASVFTPNILVAAGKYYLLFTGISAHMKVKPDSKIGMAVSDSPDGPWRKLASNPILKNSDNPRDFDSHLIDDACLITRDGKYWLYYKGRQLGKKSTQTQLGLAVADKPEGPYVKHPSNPVIPGNHEVLVWPEGDGVAALIGSVGPKEWVRSLVYSDDGVHFKKTHNVKNVPHAAGAYRPEAFTGSGKGKRIEWGVHIGKGRGLPCIERFELQGAKYPPQPAHWPPQKTTHKYFRHRPGHAEF
ncbi:MAG: family 43 glycosylhydrolase [Akkermansiaceae bacterium]|nr:family 43 glycosylhydrolase [Akkermansiaceae bacterium]